MQGNSNLTKTTTATAESMMSSKVDGSQVIKREIPETERLSLAYRASMQGRVGGDVNDIKTLKQKNKLLKQAVLAERESKAVLESEKEKLRLSYVDAQKQIEKLEETGIAQEQQIQQLKDSLLLERNNSTKYLDMYQKLKTQQLMQQSGSGKAGQESSDSFFSGFGQIIGLSPGTSATKSASSSAEIEAIQKENTRLQEELTKMKVTALNAESRAKAICAEEAKKMWEEFSKKSESLQDQLRESKKTIGNLQEQLAQKIADLTAAQHQLNENVMQIQNGQMQLQKLTNDFTFAEDKLKKNDLKLTTALKDIETKTAQLSQLQTERDTISKQLSTIEDKIMLFTLVRSSGLYSDPCQVMCRVDLEGQHLMEFDTVKEKFSLNVLDINDVICEYEPEPVLTLNLSKSNTLVFRGSASEMKVAEKKIRQFVMTAPSSKSMTRTLQQNQNAGSGNNNGKDQKGFVDNLYSFFK